jgi:hypothetical protein
MSRNAGYAIVAIALLLAACSGQAASSGAGGGETACQAAFKAAAAIDDMHDSVEDLDPAIRACRTMDEWLAASVKYPKAINAGVDPRIFLANRCFYGTGLAGTPLCRSLPPS